MCGGGEGSNLSGRAAGEAGDYQPLRGCVAVYRGRCGRFLLNYL